MKNLIMHSVDGQEVRVIYSPPVTEAFTMSGTTPPLKQQAHELIDNLPESATWDDVVYEAELRASIQHGLADSEAGRIIAVEDLMKEFGVEE